MKKRRMFASLLFAAMSVSAMAQSETECLAFLYQYMPTPDSVDYSKAYWRHQVRMALKARTQMPWGKSVPGGSLKTSCYPSASTMSRLTTHVR